MLKLGPFARLKVGLLCALLAGCLDEGRPFDEWQAEYEGRIVDEFEDVGGDQGPAFEERCTVTGGAPFSFRATNLTEEGIIAYYVTPECELEEKITVLPMTNSMFSSNVGQVWRFARESTPDVLFEQYVDGEGSSNLVFE